MKKSVSSGEPPAPIRPMPVFGVSVQDACKESGGLPRVVAETIAWLDAHGESTYIVWGRAPRDPNQFPPPRSRIRPLAHHARS